MYGCWWCVSQRYSVLRGTYFVLSCACMHMRAYTHVCTGTCAQAFETGYFPYFCLACSPVSSPPFPHLPPFRPLTSSCSTVSFREAIPSSFAGFFSCTQCLYAVLYVFIFFVAYLHTHCNTVYRMKPMQTCTFVRVCVRARVPSNLLSVDTCIELLSGDICIRLYTFIHTHTHIHTYLNVCVYVYLCV